MTCETLNGLLVGPDTTARDINDAMMLGKPVYWVPDEQAIRTTAPATIPEGWVSVGFTREGADAFDHWMRDTVSHLSIAPVSSEPAAAAPERPRLADAAVTGAAAVPTPPESAVRPAFQPQPWQEDAHGLFEQWQTKNATRLADQHARFADHNAVVAARTDIPFCWHRYHAATGLAMECMNARPCDLHPIPEPEPTPPALPRFIVFAGADYEATGGANDVLTDYLNDADPGPHAFHHVADAADEAERAVTKWPGRNFAPHEWSHIAEVTPTGLQIIAVYDATQTAHVPKVSP